MSAICSCGDIESLYVYKINSNCSLILSHFQDRNTFHRFDKFNAKYNPIGESRLRWRRWDYAVTRWHRNRPNSLGRFSWRRTTLWMENTLPDWWRRCSPTWRTPSTPTWSWGGHFVCCPVFSWLKLRLSIYGRSLQEWDNLASWAGHLNKNTCKLMRPTLHFSQFQTMSTPTTIVGWFKFLGCTTSTGAWVVYTSLH